MIAVAAAVAATILFGASFVATRFVIHETDPSTLSFIRYAIAAAVMIPLGLLWGRAAIERRDWLPILAVGALQFGVFTWFFSAAPQYIPASRAALIASTIPLWTMALAAAMREEQFSPRKLAGAVLAVAGVAVAFSKSLAVEADAADSWLGMFYVLCAAWTNSVFNVLAKTYLRKYPALPFTALGMAGGLAFLLPLAAASGTFAQVPQFTHAGWLAVLFLSVPGAALAFYLWSWALERIDSTRVAIFTPLVPISASIFAALILAEEMTPRFLGGLVMVVSGVTFASWQAKPAAAGAGAQ